jgi:hypothetical protein
MTSAELTTEINLRAIQLRMDGQELILRGPLNL